MTLAFQQQQIYQIVLKATRKIVLLKQPKPRIIKYKDYLKFDNKVTLLKSYLSGKILQANVRIHKHFTKYPEYPCSYERKKS